MKLNHRLLITSGLLLAMSTVAMSTATYAWFTTNRQAKFSTANVGISADSNLEYRVISVNSVNVNYTADGLASIKNQSNASAIDALVAKSGWTAAELPDGIISGASLTDVSGNGAVFYKPTMGANASYYSNIKEVNSTGAFVPGYFMNIQVEFRSSAAFEVYLGANTNLTDVDVASDATSLSAAARIAYFDYGQSCDSELPSLTVNNGTSASASKASGTYSCVFVNDNDTPRYLAEASDEGGLFEQVGEDEATAVYNYFPYGTVQQGTPEAITSTAATADTLKVTKLVKNTKTEGEGEGMTTVDVKYTDNEGNENVLHTAVIDIRIWVEGTDVHCVDTAKKSTFKATLDFQAYLA